MLSPYVTTEQVEELAEALEVLNETAEPEDTVSVETSDGYTASGEAPWLRLTLPDGTVYWVRVYEER